MPDPQREQPTYKTSWALRYHGYAAKPWLDTELAEKAAKEWAQAHGFFGAVGGWIYRESNWSKARRAEQPEALRRGHAVTQGWFNFYTYFRSEIRGWYATKLTAFPSFDALVNAPNYRPTILVKDSPRDWRWAYLAEVYDVFQAGRGDPRRAHTGYAVKPAPEADHLAWWRKTILEAARV